MTRKPPAHPGDANSSLHAAWTNGLRAIEVAEHAMNEARAAQTWSPGPQMVKPPRGVVLEG